MTTRAVYVLEIKWSWDNVNIEYATITVEEPEEGFEVLLNTKFRPERKEALLWQLKKVFEALDRSIMGKGEMVALYRISGPGDYKWVQKKNVEGDIVLTLHLKPVCGFDKDGNPVPIGDSHIEVPGTGIVIEH